MPLRDAQQLRENDLLERGPMATGGRVSRQPAHGADLRRALTVESGGMGCAFIFAEHARARRAGCDGRDRRVWFRLVRIRPRAGFRAGGKRTAGDRHTFTTLEGFIRTRTASWRLRRRAAMDDS